MSLALTMDNNHVKFRPNRTYQYKDMSGYDFWLNLKCELDLEVMTFIQDHVTRLVMDSTVCSIIQIQLTCQKL